MIQKDVMFCYLQNWHSRVVHVPQHVRHLIQVVNLNITARNHLKFQGAINELTLIMETKTIVFKFFQGPKLASIFISHSEHPNTVVFNSLKPHD